MSSVSSAFSPTPMVQTKSTSSKFSAVSRAAASDLSLETSASASSSCARNSFRSCSIPLPFSMAFRSFFWFHSHFSSAFFATVLASCNSAAIVATSAAADSAAAALCSAALSLASASSFAATRLPLRFSPRRRARTWRGPAATEVRRRSRRRVRLFARIRRPPRAPPPRPSPRWRRRGTPRGP